MNTPTITDLKNAIANQQELELIAKEVYFMNFIRLIRQGFELNFAAEKATLIAQRQISLLTN